MGFASRRPLPVAPGVSAVAASRHSRHRRCDFKRVCQQTTSGFVVTELRACGSQVSEARAPWTFEYFADQGVELLEIDRISEQKNIGDQRRLADLYGRLSRQ